MEHNCQSSIRDSSFYMHTGKMPLASKLSLHVRKKMFSLFMVTMRPDKETTILDLGVTSDTKYKESNYFEQFYPYKDKIVCAGTEDGSYLEQTYPGITFVIVKAHNPLPFDDQQFDIVFSNAVIEHTGGVEGQRFFIKEILRVSQAFFITTPNRWFPIEMHTGLPLLHYLPKHIYRFLIGKTAWRYWASEDSLNLLDSKSFARLFPPAVSKKLTAVTLMGLPSNLIAYSKPHSCINNMSKDS